MDTHFKSTILVTKCWGTKSQLLFIALYAFFSFSARGQNSVEEPEYLAIGDLANEKIQCSYICDGVEKCEGTYEGVSIYCNEGLQILKPPIKFVDLAMKRVRISDLQPVADSLITLRCYSLEKLEEDADTRFPMLRYFGATDRGLKYMPAFLEKCDSLITLAISVKCLKGEDLKKLPPGLQLLTLYVEREKLDSFPPEIFDMKELKHLTISARLKSPPRLNPDWINDDTKIEYLDIPIDLRDKQNIIALKKFKHLQMIYINSFIGEDYSVFGELSHISSIFIKNLSIEKKREIRAKYKNILVYR